MATVLYLALVVAAYGMISLLTDSDLISAPGTSPLVGPMMTAAQCALVFISVLFSLRPGNRPGLPWGRAVVTTLIVYLVGPAVGAILLAFDQADGLAGMLLFAKLATGPFIVASALIVFPVVLLAPLLAPSTNRPR